MSGNEIAALTQSAFTEGFKEGELYILEKLKIELIDCFSQENDIDSDPYNHALDIAISIVHDHISELKGENNGAT